MNPSMNPMQMPRPKSLTGSFSSALQWSSISLAVNPPCNQAAKFAGGATTHNKVPRSSSAAFFIERPDTRLWWVATLSQTLFAYIGVWHWAKTAQRYCEVVARANRKGLDQAMEFPGRVNCQNVLPGGNAI